MTPRLLLPRTFHSALLLVLTTSALSCKFADAPMMQVQPTITIAVAPASINVLRAGSAVTATITVARQDYTGAVTLSVIVDGTGVTATLDQTTLSPTMTTSTLTIRAVSDAPGGPRNVAITASGTGVASMTAGLQLIVGYPSVTLTKAGTGSGTVTSNPTGLNCGSACVAGFWVGANVTLTAAPAAGSVFTGWSGGACTGTTLTCALTLNSVSAGVTATFNSTAASFSLGITPTLVSIPQGGNGREMVAITRANGFAGPVNLSVTGAPAGLTITPSPASITADTISLFIAASSAVPAGNYLLTVTATGTGVPQRTVTFNVQVTPAAGGSSSVALSFAGCDPSQTPIWAAVQSDNGPWTRVNATGNTFVFPLGAKNGIAYVLNNGGTTYSTSVFYGTRNDVTSIAIGDPCLTSVQTGTKAINLTINSVNIPPVFATISIGGADTIYSALSGSNLKLTGVPAGRRDIIGATHIPTGTNNFVNVQKLFLRRDVDYANNANVPLLDFNSAESFVPAAHLVAFNNIGTDQGYVSEFFLTANGASAPFHSEPTGPQGRARLFTVPDSVLRGNDFHAMELDVLPQGNNPTSGRFALAYFHRGADQTINFGPPLAAATVTTLAQTPYVRARAVLPAQPEYSGAAGVDFEQNGTTVSILVTAAYFNTTPQSWTLDVPDLTAAGYDAVWGLRTGVPVDWSVSAVSGSILPFAGALPQDGAFVVGASATSSFNARQSQRAGPFRIIRWP